MIHLIGRPHARVVVIAQRDLSLNTCLYTITAMAKQNEGVF